MNSMRIKKMLVPTDLSAFSEKAIEHAISLAKVFPAQIFLLHVMEPPAYGLDFSLTNFDVPAEVKRKFEENIKQWVEEIKELDMVAKTYFIMDIPHEEIIKAAKKYDA